MMGNQWVLGLHFLLLNLFMLATTYTCLAAHNSTIGCHERERLALLKFKSSIKYDYGMLLSWVGNDCCSWKGVRCDGATGSVASLHLRGNYMGIAGYEYRFTDYMASFHYTFENYYLVGDKVNALAELSHLKHLDLSGNQFGGSRIPEFIGSFKQLSYLNLSNAGFSGNIPHHIGNLSNLKVLDLYSSVVTQWLVMPNDITWVSGLSALEHLDLSGVDYSQAKNIDMVWYLIPSLTDLSLRSFRLSNVDLGLHVNSSKILPNIKHLDLSFNHFEGQLPHFFENMTSLTFLDLSYNDLSLAWNSLNLLNKIPSLKELHLSECGLYNAPNSPGYFNLSAKSNIQYLDLSGNSIEGRFPYELMNMTSLSVLDLSKNRLNSSIPVMPNLLKLDVSSNNFEHIELVGIWRQCHLKELRLSSNDFEEEMTSPSTNTSECSQYALEMLDLHENKLNGSIPTSLESLTNLRVLDLMLNSLTGSIPKSLARIRSLEVLRLAYNDLTGPIPTFLGKLTNLDLSRNRFIGSIPESLGRLTTLTELVLDSNQLTGPIPASIGRLASLQTFSLSSNLLNGTIPVSVGQLTKLVHLDVSNNYLEGVVSEAHFANLSLLEYLDTSFNHNLTFNISLEWKPPFQLRNVRLASCKIAHGFPQWLQAQTMLRELVLSNSRLYGLLPTWLQNMSIISYLDLSFNKLSGSLINLPSSEYTQFLLLQDNLFNGSIPRSLCRKTLLKLFDVSTNRLSRNIPECLQNLQHMVMLKLSLNGLSGVLPSFIGNISSQLEWLKLNDNKFNGKLPRELGSLSSLSVLDLGNNEFSGNIPNWVGKNLTNLVVLRLHKNNFTGKIPQSLCKCSYLHILDVAHNNLTGSIPRCFGELSGMIKETQEDSKDPRVIRGEEVINVPEVNQVIKGLQLEYTKTLYLLFNMDLSSNNLIGQIPLEVTTLTSLVGLNLSHNNLNGSIPNSIGNMKALNSLDFSDNQFTGMIPPSIAALNFLSSLDLSHNNLSGRIPTGNQLQTLTDPSIYAGNRNLCGAPLPNNCSNPGNPPTTSKNKYEDADHEPRNIWFYANIMGGFATGFWGIIGVLLYKKQWRHKLFIIAEATMDNVYVAVAVRVSKIKRGREVN